MGFRRTKPLTRFRKGLYAFRPASQQSPQVCSRKGQCWCSWTRIVPEFGGRKIGKVLSPPLFPWGDPCCEAWSVRVQNVSRASLYFCHAKMQVSCDNLLCLPVCLVLHCLWLRHGQGSRPTVVTATEANPFRTQHFAAGSQKKSWHESGRGLSSFWGAGDVGALWEASHCTACVTASAYMVRREVVTQQAPLSWCPHAQSFCLALRWTSPRLIPGYRAFRGYRNVMWLAAGIDDDLYFCTAFLWLVIYISICSTYLTAESCNRAWIRLGTPPPQPPLPSPPHPLRSLTCLSSVRLLTCWIDVSARLIYNFSFASLHYFTSSKSAWSKVLRSCFVWDMLWLTPPSAYCPLVTCPAGTAWSQ